MKNSTISKIEIVQKIGNKQISRKYNLVEFRFKKTKGGIINMNNDKFCPYCYEPIFLVPYNNNWYYPYICPKCGNILNNNKIIYSNRTILKENNNQQENNENQKLSLKYKF